MMFYIQYTTVYKIIAIVLYYVLCGQILARAITFAVWHFKLHRT